MSEPQPLPDRLQFDSEHAKRDRRITPEQQQKWADELISHLPDSLAYQQACTPQARLQEQALLNQLVAQWKNALPRTSE
jgi:hypothetical protein